MTGTRIEEVTNDNLKEIQQFIKNADCDAIAMALQDEVNSQETLVNETGPLIAYGKLLGIRLVFRRLREIARNVPQRKQQGITKDPDMNP